MLISWLCECSSYPVLHGTTVTTLQPPAGVGNQLVTNTLFITALQLVSHLAKSFLLQYLAMAHFNMASAGL